MLRGKAHISILVASKPSIAAYQEKNRPDSAHQKGRAKAKHMLWCGTRKTPDMIGMVSLGGSARVVTPATAK